MTGEACGWCGRTSPEYPGICDDCLLHHFPHLYERITAILNDKEVTLLVKFNEENEFINELRKQYPLGSATTTSPLILRLTGMARASMGSPNIKHYSVIATIPSHDEPGAIIRLERHCGDLYRVGQVDEEVHKKAKKVEGDIKMAAGILGIEVRAGVYEA